MAVFHVAGHGDFQWDRHEFTLAEGIALEDATGRLFDELVTLYNAQRRAGAAAFAWLAMRRNGVNVPFREFVAGLTVSSLRESFDDETPADQGAGADGDEGQAADTGGDPADPPARPAAARARRASTRRTDSAPGKAASARK